MFQEFPENNNDDDFLNEFRQRLANQANSRGEEKQKELQRSRGVFLGAVAGVGLACIVGWLALAPSNGNTSDEDVPVIRRPQEPVKIKPTEPGGMEILNQDKTVYDMIDNSSEETASKVEQVLPAPEEPKLPTVAPETITEIVEQTETVTVTEAPKPEPVTAPAPQVEEEEYYYYNPAAPVVESTPAPTVDDTPTPVVEEAPAPTVDDTPDRDYTLGVPRVQDEDPFKQQDVEVAEAPKVETPKVVEAPKAVAAPTGVWQIQLASSKNKDAIEKSWTPTVKKYPVLEGLTYEVETADLEFDGTFYRLKAGSFADKAEADKICNEIKSQGGSCLVKKKQ